MRSLGPAAVLMISGCGGNGGGLGAAPPLAGLPLFDPGLAATPQVLAVVGIDDASGGVLRQSTTLTGTKLAGSVIAGTVDVAGQRLNLGGGGSGPLTTFAGTDQLFGFSAGSVFGVAGLASPSVPGGGTATYAGTLRAFIDDGVAPEDLSGGVTVSANFNFGTLNVNAGSITSASRAGSLAINGATIAGTGFTGGSLTLTGNFATLPATGTVTHAGQFFGPNGDEVGGAFRLNQISGGNQISIVGSYAAD